MMFSTKNTSPDGDTTFTHHTNKATNTPSPRDNFYVWALLLLGIAGFSLSFESPFVESPNEVIQASMHQVSSTSFKQIDPSYKTKILLRGEARANERISFVIDNYVSSYNYKFVFGNGKSRQVDDKECTYTFPEKGCYNVELLLIMPDGSTKSLAKKKVKVK